MTTRRRSGWLLLAVFLAPPAVAAAQEGAPAPAAAGDPGGSPAPPAARKPRRPSARRQARQQRAPNEASRQAAPAGPQDTEHRLEAAPVPNRDLEAPRSAQTDRTRLSPSVIHRPLPSQGMAVEGAQNIQEERLFFPAPGARLNVPFSY